ncbi:4-hydroxythreonine-4-phosphate dehydrogenase PdxA [candidate division KSB1 bacterium]|nr:4-hydroxythreonine-4-phosphate dehydrogenase PdxA [candidate division KSB1 bacterium]NIR71341.1 4-hydroxythreonine-4-phosphate dehydrogenase PdxA [candidate division KSB1 bacterium]NIS26231.1 4-hydroxythreonine-4-phosphate dehydrogenase PdxA [candidate division KSB1 bacterium]NIT74661.1 4-hydroxythreonine-4-phosphate dehydrogenase PdxA [candidate division KSB1 bacterium]NIU26879.1 4-hydroxythreonine-4-phosphate dehydrogenase PdxA [candidate division KSB1 bacterium]
MTDRPLIAVTIGDPNGIGPEVVLKALFKAELTKACRPIVIGPTHVIEEHLNLLQLDRELSVNSSIDEITFFEDRVNILDTGFDADFSPQAGQISGMAGKIAGKALELAVRLAMEAKVEAIVTGSISKEAFHLAGYDFPGQSEFLAAATKTDEIVMVLLSDNFRVGLVTTHCALSEVPKRLNELLILNKIEVLDKDLRQRFRIPNPRIAVTGLNPHAGEGGLLGNEEPDIIVPAIDTANRRGVNVAGPYPADTMFARCETIQADAYLAMYHDQGLIPLKMRSFGRGVNYTAGLPIIRTSPDHGTAFDIAGKGRANSMSMEEAIKLAVKLAT